MSGNPFERYDDFGNRLGKAKPAQGAPPPDPPPGTPAGVPERICSCGWSGSKADWAAHSCAYKPPAGPDPSLACDARGAGPLVTYDSQGRPIDRPPSETPVPKVLTFTSIFETSRPSESAPDRPPDAELAGRLLRLVRGEAECPRCGAAGGEPCLTWRGAPFAEGTRHAERGCLTISLPAPTAATPDGCGPLACTASVSLAGRDVPVAGAITAALGEGILGASVSDAPFSVGQRVRRRDTGECLTVTDHAADGKGGWLLRCRRGNLAGTEFDVRPGDLEAAFLVGDLVREKGSGREMAVLRTGHHDRYGPNGVECWWPGGGRGWFHAGALEKLPPGG